MGAGKGGGCHWWAEFFAEPVCYCSQTAGILAVKLCPEGLSSAGKIGAVIQFVSRGLQLDDQRQQSSFVSGFFVDPVKIHTQSITYASHIYPG